MPHVWFGEVAQQISAMVEGKYFMARPLADSSPEKSVLWEHGRGGSRRLRWCKAVTDVAPGGHVVSSTLTQEPFAQILSLMSLWTHAYFPLTVQAFV